MTGILIRIIYDIIRYCVCSRRLCKALALSMEKIIQIDIANDLGRVVKHA